LSEHVDEIGRTLDQASVLVPVNNLPSESVLDAACRPILVSSRARCWGLLDSVAMMVGTDAVVL